jgi:hypothetical protein
MPKLLLIIAIAVGVNILSYAQEGEDLFMLFDENIEAPPFASRTHGFYTANFLG